MPPPDSFVVSRSASRLTPEQTAIDGEISVCSSQATKHNFALQALEKATAPKVAGAAAKSDALDRLDVNIELIKAIREWCDTTKTKGTVYGPAVNCVSAKVRCFAKSIYG